MLTADDLKEIGNHFTLRMEKTVSKIKHERNPKIVNYKIRAFIENIRDKLKRFEPISLVDYPSTVVNKGSQLDRIELTIGQVLNTVQKFFKMETPLETLTPDSIIQYDDDIEAVPSRQRSRSKDR